ncbi:MAG TPA: TraB/GumN family protein [Rhizomicrobium sp.]|nr:TraB/GumN family protein [Rhizomicrobium sp.]
MLASLPLAAPAQAVDEWAEIESVVVRERPGPALWHLTRGDSEVWILGMPGAPLPQGLDWNRQYLSDLFDGARAILMPPRPNVALTDIVWFLIRHGSEMSLPRGQVLEQTLPDDLRTRFIAARDAVGGDESDYRTDIPIRAAMRLWQNMMKKANLSFEEPRKTISDLADHKDIPAKPILRFDGMMDAFRDVLKLTPEQQRVCLGQRAEDVTWALAHAEKAGRAWAVGDLKTMKANYGEDRFGNCIVTAVKAMGDIGVRNNADIVAAIDVALNQPGKTIALVPVGALLSKGGVLEQLDARHIAIEGPAD